MLLMMMMTAVMMMLMMMMMMMMVMIMMMMPARAIVASGVKVLRAGHLELVSVNKPMMRLVMRLMM